MLVAKAQELTVLTCCHYSIMKKIQDEWKQIDMSKETFR
jgi:hypothetical protein